MSALVRLHSGALASTSVTSVSVTSPSFVTLIVHLTFEPPGATNSWSFGFLVTVMCGVPGGGGGGTVTCAESEAETSGPVGGVPVSVATLVKLAVTPVRLHV